MCVSGEGAHSLAISKLSVLRKSQTRVMLHLNIPQYWKNVTKHTTHYIKNKPFFYNIKYKNLNYYTV